MADITVIYQSKTWLPIIGCQEVAACLNFDSWSSKFVNGIPYLFATVQNNIRSMGDGSAMFGNVRGEYAYQYTLVYDDSQLNVDPATEEPYLVNCDDINSILDACMVSAIIGIVDAFGGIPEQPE